MSESVLRLLVYDRTCVGRFVGLSSAWGAGAFLYRAQGRIDAAFGATCWSEALDWLATFGGALPIGEIQYWGHGKWGRAFIARDMLDSQSFIRGHALFDRLEAVRERLLPDGQSLLWLRTCESFGAHSGIDFAQALANGFGACVAGHTHIIGVLQSGLHGLAPGQKPMWSPWEGLAAGTPDKPARAFGSSPFRPQTISCFDGHIPDAWFDGRPPTIRIL